MSSPNNEKKTLFYDQIYLDWALWVGLGIGFISSLTQSRGALEANSSSVPPGRADILANLIDSTISVAISLLVFSIPISLIRRKSNGENLAMLSELDDSEKRNRKLFVAGAILLLGITSAAISHFRDGGSVDDILSDSRSITQCQPQGEDELCITATSSSNSRIVLDLQLAYKDSRQFNGEWVGATSWKVAIDCPTRMLEVSSVKFFDERSIEVPLSSEQLAAVTEGLETDSAALLSQCTE